jgi:hypothetical protein
LPRSKDMRGCLAAWSHNLTVQSALRMERVRGKGREGAL